ncbi:hypothetical protein LF41_2234 [Lysobacter dokdonensis DS-58]|uniref:DUF5329 domain-containing protein n=1 Tax=Lysobacter dokdonensis DS-58 TaxID=1300345 RepID=A0A0A2WMW0_9GAMM|nr:DUF5329 domain-containing protein [Lysobacter dokdonensis]KGQ20067.1 hypothetical protein LF41_2234 [Lysobacter dokdonensis DS-58]
MRTLLLAVFLAAIAPAMAAQPAATTTVARTPAAEIDALIERVGHSKGVVFIRNGTEYSAADAAAHLQRKRKAAGNRIKTPEQFIDKLGARSSMTGKPYRVRLASGTEMDSAAWLNGLLREVRAGR